MLLLRYPFPPTLTRFWCAFHGHVPTIVPLHDIPWPIVVLDLLYVGAYCEDCVVNLPCGPRIFQPNHGRLLSQGGVLDSTFSPSFHRIAERKGGANSRRQSIDTFVCSSLGRVRKSSLRLIDGSDGSPQLASRHHFHLVRSHWKRMAWMRDVALMSPPVALKVCR